VSDSADRTSTTGVTEPSPPTRRLSEILLASVTALAAAGEVEQACRLAGQACVALRGADPAAAGRFDVLLHRLTPTLTW
jgi:hypothetical protein